MRKPWSYNVNYKMTLLAEEEPCHGEAVLPALGAVEGMLHQLRDATPVDACDVVAETISTLKRTSGFDNKVTSNSWSSAEHW